MRIKSTVDTCRIDICENEKADVLAKKETSQLLLACTQSLQSSKTRSMNWYSCSRIPIIWRVHMGRRARNCFHTAYNVSRAVNIALFRTITGLDYLATHLFHIQMLLSNHCLLCGGKNMDGYCLKVCSSLDREAHVEEDITYRTAHLS